MTSTRIKRSLSPVVAAILVAAGIGAPASAQTPQQLEDELIELQQTLQSAEADRAETLAEIDRLEADINDMNAEIAATKVRAAAAQSAVQHRRGKLKRGAVSLYRRPVSQVALLISAGDINDYVVGQKYLVDVVNRDAAEIEEYRQAQRNEEQLRQDLRQKRRDMEAAIERKEEWQQIVDRSIAAEQKVLADLEKKLERARELQAFPWAPFGSCPVPQTGLEGPYNLEDWAVWTLKSIAGRLGLVETNVLTREHVIALVAFAWGEGGGIQGHRGQFNPLNLNGWTALFAELGGDASGRGTDDWPTFDAGVEASARALTSRQYSRLKLALIDPFSTADDFFANLAFPFAFPGNKNWSANDALHVGKYASLTARTRADYNRFAGEPLRAATQTLTRQPRLPSGNSAPGAFGGKLVCSPGGAAAAETLAADAPAPGG